MTKLKKKIKWSYTRVKTFKECREKYYRRYVLKEYPEENHMKYLEGNVVQNLFEHFINYNHFKGPDPEKWIQDNIKVYYNKHFNDSKKPCTFRKADSEKKLLKSITKMCNNTYQMRLNKGFFEEGVEIKSEVGIREQFGPNSDVWGKIDFVIFKDNELWVLDLKSTHTKYIDPKQLLFYAYLIYLRKGRLVDKAFFFTSKDNKVLNLNVTQERVDKLVAMIKEIEKITESTDYREMTSDKNACWGCSNRIPCWAENNQLGDVKPGDLGTFE